MELRRLLGVALPAQERLPGLVSGGKERVGGDDAGEAVRVLGRQAQADEPAPVLAHEGDVAQVQALD